MRARLLLAPRSACLRRAHSSATRNPYRPSSAPRRWVPSEQATPCEHPSSPQPGTGCRMRVLTHTWAVARVHTAPFRAAIGADKPEATGRGLSRPPAEPERDLRTRGSIGTCGRLGSCWTSLAPQPCRTQPCASCRCAPRRGALGSGGSSPPSARLKSSAGPASMDLGALQSDEAHCGRPVLLAERLAHGGPGLMLNLAPP